MIPPRADVPYYIMNNVRVSCIVRVLFVKIGKIRPVTNPVDNLLGFLLDLLGDLAENVSYQYWQAGCGICLH